MCRVQFFYMVLFQWSLKWYLNPSDVQNKHCRKSRSITKHHMPPEVYAFTEGKGMMNKEEAGAYWFRLTVFTFW